MKRHFLQYFFNMSHAAAAVVTVLFVIVFLWLTDMLADYDLTDEMSPLNPIFSRMEFINIDDISLDAIFAMNDLRNGDSRIVVVNVGEVAPTPDGRIAMLLYKLHGYGARVIGLDILLDRLHFEQFQGDRLQEIESLRQALSDVPNVVIANGFDETTLTMQVVPDSAVTAGVKFQGFANIEKDDDEVVRRYWPYRTINGSRWASLPVQMIRVYDSSLAPPVPGSDDETEIINYCGTYAQFQTVPMDDVIYSERYARMFKDAIVLVGFVNEGGLFYLDDTHKTPMGRKTERSRPDGTTAMGVEGPDMAGILIHANVLHMLLNRSFITPVPPVIDMLIAFVLAYLSIALYTLLRTKARSGLGVGILITVVIVVESIFVFFAPIIAYFFFGIKIAYHTLATVVVLFIPVAAMVVNIRFFYLRLVTRYRFARTYSPLATRLQDAFEDDEAFPADFRLIHAAQCLVHFALAVRLAERAARGESIEQGAVLPFMAVWQSTVPELRDLLEGNISETVQEQHFIRFLSGKKDQLLRDSYVKDLFFSTELRYYNEFFYADEWELLLPYVLHLYHHTLREYLGHTIILVDSLEGSLRFRQLRKGDVVEEIPSPNGNHELQPGTYLMQTEENPIFTRLSPFCELAECKLHRRNEFFVFAGMLPKQFDHPPLPAYFGATLACEPVLPHGTDSALAELLNVSMHIRENQYTRSKR